MSDQMERQDFMQRVGILAGTAAAATLIGSLRLHRLEPNP
jgi:hypothetical protein